MCRLYIIFVYLTPSLVELVFHEAVEKKHHTRIQVL